MKRKVTSNPSRLFQLFDDVQDYLLHTGGIRAEAKDWAEAWFGLEVHFTLCLSESRYASVDPGSALASVFITVC